MTCKVEKNSKNGKINKVLDEQGRPSVLFQKLLNIPTLSLEETLNTYKNIYSDKINKNGTKRLSQTEDQNDAKNSQIATRSTNFLREKSRADEKNTSDEQKSELEIFAKENNYWVEDYNTLGEYIGKGMESLVYINKEGTKVYKINDLEFYDTPVGYLNTLSEYNKMFPESSYNLIGFTRREDSDKFSFILEQPFIEAERGATQEEVNKELEKLGFSAVGEAESYRKDNIEILDLHEGNVLVDTKGSVFFIDPVIFVKEEKNNLQEPSPKFNDYNTYEEAVKNTKLGENIKVTINEVEVASISNDGDINDLIRQDVLQDKRELTPKGDLVFITKGDSFGKKLVNAEIAREILNGRINRKGDVITFDKPTYTDFSNDFQKNAQKYGETLATTILASQIVEKNTPSYGNNRVMGQDLEIESETVLISKLKNLLQDLGIKTVSLERWQEKTGNKVTANALADISDKIIAFSNGSLNQDSLTEEVMHFVVEALDQEELKPILDVVNKTDEWKEYSQVYSKIYNNEDQVRREVLGKVLKNYIQNRIEQSTLQGQSVTERLVQLLNKFFDKIRNYLKPTHLQQIDNLKQDIYNKLMSDELFNELKPEQFTGNKLVMYQTTNSPLYNSINKTLESFKVLDKLTGGTNQYQLNEIQLQDFDEKTQLKSILGLAETIKSHITHLNRRGKQKGFLSTEETIVYDVAENQVAPALMEVATIIRNTPMEFNKVLKDQVMKEVDTTFLTLEKLKGDLQLEKEQKSDELIDRIAKESGLTDAMKEILKKEIDTVSRDTNQFYALFGGLAHAQNPILNVLSSISSKIHREENLIFTNRQNNFLNKANELGFKDEEVASILKKFKDGSYFLSPYDFKQLELEKSKIKLSIYKEITGENIEEQDFINTEEELKAKLTQDQLKNYLTKTTDSLRKSGLYIDILDKKEREKIEKITEKFSLKTKNYLNQLSSKKRNVFRRAQENGGLSSEDVYELEQIMHMQQKLASPYNQEGKLLKGLSLNEEGEVILNEDINTIEDEELKSETISTYELNHYNFERRKDFSNNKSSAPLKFLQEVQKIREEQGLEKAEEFIRLNSRISYNNNFWESFDKNKNITNQLIESGNEDLADLIDRNKVKLKNLLRQNSRYNNPSQINFEDMGGSIISEIKEIVGDLNELYQQTKNILPKVDREDTISESKTNEDYVQQQVDRNLITVESKLEFILEHVTSADKKSIQRNIDNYRKYKEGILNILPKAFTNFDTKTEDENIIEYAESRLLPYFKELKPKDTNVNYFLVDLLNVKDENSYEKLLEDYKYISFSPAYIWLDSESNDRLNPEYKKRRDLNEPLINLDYKGGILKNKKYNDYFGINNDKASKNVKEFELLKEIIEFQEDTSKSAGMEDKHNKYQLPQFRRQRMARLAQLANNTSIGNIKEAIKDITTIREDDPILGQSIDGQSSQNYQRGSLKVPRLGFQKLENEEEVTDEILYSTMLMAKEAEKRKQRINALIEIESLRTKLLNRQYGDKVGESTTTYKMFDDFVRYNIYGQTETFKWETDFFGLSDKKRNLAPIIRHFQGWVRLVNLGFSVLTPMTSLFQGTTNYFIEKFVGDRIDKDASRLARRKIPKLMTEYTSEIFNVRAKGELNLMLQFFGLESATERFKNTNYGKVVRGITDKASFITHTLGDLPLTAQTVMTVLHDYRNVNGELLNYSEWRTRNRNLLENQARVEWSKYAENTAYSYLETVNGEMKMKDTFYTDIKNAKDRLVFLKNRIQIAKQEIDNQIPQEDKGAVQRHAIYSFFTLHKGFLISSLTKRLKSKHLNLYSGQIEEGTYLGTFNFLADMIKEAKKIGLKEAWKGQFKEYTAGNKKLDKNGKFYIIKIENKKEKLIGEFENKEQRDSAYNDIVGQETRNRQIAVKRAISDTLVVNVLALLALMAKQAADDDDDDYTKEFMAYSMYRLATEVTSQSLGLPAQGYAFLESPSVGLSQLNNAMDIFDLTSDKKVKNGSYRGLSKREAWVMKSIPLFKEYNKVINIDRTRNSYEHFNSNYLENFSMAGMIIDSKKDK